MSSLMVFAIANVTKQGAGVEKMAWTLAAPLLFLSSFHTLYMRHFLRFEGPSKEMGASESRVRR